MENNKPASQDKTSSGVNLSPWFRETGPLKFSKPLKNGHADVVIVGGGISGVTCAYLLSKEGKKVVLFEDGNIGSGETGRTTAHLVNALDDRYYELERIHDKKTAALAAESHTAAIRLIEKIVAEEGISCNFKRLPGYLFLHPSDSEESLQKELTATHRAGINTQIMKITPGIINYHSPCLVFPDQARFHPLKYLEGLCKKILSNSGQLYTDTHVTEVSGKGVKTADGIEYTADHIIVATNTPINNRFVLHTKQHAYRTYAIAATVPKDAYPDALWWDTGNQDSEWPTMPYHYVRMQEFNDQYDLLIVGGEDHKTGQSDAEHVDEAYRFSMLESWTNNHFPRIVEIVNRWSGQIMEPVDSLGFIGRNPNDSKNVYVATGDSGNGMTHGTIAGMLLTDMIMGRKNPWEDIYNPNRIRLSTVSDYLQENLNVAKQYGDYFTPGDLPEVDQVQAGHGAVIRKGRGKIAVYRDTKGEMHLFSAVCPHLGCIVEWNQSEKSFDCPCHGSRFSCYGKVMNGPANEDLEEIRDTAPHP